MKARPLGDRVLIEQSKTAEKSSGGLIIPDTVDGLHKKGTVVAVGTGLFTQTGDKIRMTVKEGDTVLFDKSHEKKTVKVDNQDYVLMRESDILMVLND